MFHFKISFRLLPWSSRRCTRASSTGRDVPSRATLAITSKRFFTTSFPFTARWNDRRHQQTPPSWIGSCFDSSNPSVKRSIDFSAAFPGWTPMAAFRYILRDQYIGDSFTRCVPILNGWNVSGLWIVQLLNDWKVPKIAPLDIYAIVL